MRVVLSLSFLGLVAAAPTALAAQRFNALGVTNAAATQYFADLQRAVAANNRTTVIRMVNYPLRVSYAHTRHERIATAAELIRRYDEIFTPFIRHAITSDKLSDVFVNSEGMAIQRGTVWVTSACNRAQPPVCHLGVGSVNLP